MEIIMTIVAVYLIIGIVLAIWNYIGMAVQTDDVIKNIDYLLDTDIFYDGWRGSRKFKIAIFAGLMWLFVWPYELYMTKKLVEALEYWTEDVSLDDPRLTEMRKDEE